MATPLMTLCLLYALQIRSGSWKATAVARGGAAAKALILPLTTGCGCSTRGDVYFSINLALSIKRVIASGIKASAKPAKNDQISSLAMLE